MLDAALLLKLWRNYKYLQNWVASLSHYCGLVFFLFVFFLAVKTALSTFYSEEFISIFNVYFLSDCIVVEGQTHRRMPDRERYGSMKLLQFHENYRPAYWGTWSKKSSHVSPRCPFRQDKVGSFYKSFLSDISQVINPSSTSHYLNFYWDINQMWQWIQHFQCQSCWTINCLFVTSGFVGLWGGQWRRMGRRGTRRVSVTQWRGQFCW